MTKIERKQTIMRAFLSFVLIAVLAVAMVIGGGFTAPTAYAAEGTVYSDVLDDLQKDENFSESNYPYVADDYSLQVMQIAESTDNELFVYVYQPSGEIKNLAASSINISLKPREDISDIHNYKLRLLNADGVFFKYLVEGLTVSTANTRYYTVTTIYRPFDETIDKQADHGNTVTEVDYKVAKEYCFGTINGEPFNRVLDIETIEITDKFVGFVRYSNGFHLYVGKCDSHFVAFNTDRDIDRLLEADVYYTSQSYSYSFAVGAGENETFGEKQDNYAYLTYKQKVEHTGDGWFAPTYTWDRIETVEQFIAENETFQNVYSGALIDVSVANEITEEGKEALKGKQWVLRFAETDYSLGGGYGSTYSFSTIVGDVTILRLKFETDGITYNLGTIDNKQSGDPDDPINEEETIVEPGKALDILGLILLVVGLLLLVIILAPVLPYILKAVIWVVMLPFKAIAALVNAIKKAATKKPKTTASSPTKAVKAPQPKTVYVKSDKPKQGKEKQNK